MSIQFAPAPFTANMRAPMTDQAIDDLRARNEKRAAEAREKLGEAYCLHPVNRVGRHEAKFIKSFIDGIRLGRAKSCKS